VLADTGLRPSEAVNLQARAIHLDAPIPFVEVLPDGRVLKTEDSRREIPLVGSALAAMRMRPNGFPASRLRRSMGARNPPAHHYSALKSSGMSTMAIKAMLRKKMTCGSFSGLALAMASSR
jgi:integrase